MLAHMMHNGVAVSFILWPELAPSLGLDFSRSAGHLPSHVLLVGGLVFVLGLVLLSRRRLEAPAPSTLSPQLNHSAGLHSAVR